MAVAERILHLRPDADTRPDRALVREAQHGRAEAATVLVMREMEGMSYADIAQVVGPNPRGVEATLRRARARFRTEVSRAESAEVARATCRRVLRLVGDDPQASRSEEAAAHLAHCADCRRQARLGVDGRPSIASRAFGFFPPLLGLGHLAALFRPSALTPSVRR